MYLMLFENVNLATHDPIPYSAQYRITDPAIHLFNVWTESIV